MKAFRKIILILFSSFFSTHLLYAPKNRFGINIPLGSDKSKYQERSQFGSNIFNQPPWQTPPAEPSSQKEPPKTEITEEEIAARFGGGKKPIPAKDVLREPQVIESQLRVSTIQSPSPKSFLEKLEEWSKNEKTWGIISNFLKNNFSFIKNPGICTILLYRFPTLFKTKLPADMEDYFLTQITPYLDEQVKKYRNFLESKGITFLEATEKSLRSLEQSHTQKEIAEVMTKLFTIKSVNPEKFFSESAAEDEEEQKTIRKYSKGSVEVSLSTEPSSEKLEMTPTRLKEMLQHFKSEAISGKEPLPFSSFPQLITTLNNYQELYSIIESIKGLGGPLVADALKNSLWQIITELGKTFATMYQPRFLELQKKREEEKAIKEAIEKAEPSKEVVEEIAEAQPELKKEIQEAVEEELPIPTIGEEAAAELQKSLETISGKPKVEPFEPISPELEKKISQLSKEAVIPKSDQPEIEAIEKVEPATPAQKQAQAAVKKEILETIPEQKLRTSLTQTMIKTPDIKNLQRFLNYLTDKNKPERIEKYKDTISSFIETNAEQITDPLVIKFLLEKLLPILKDTISENTRKTLLKSYMQGFIDKINNFITMINECGATFKNQFYMLASSLIPVDLLDKEKAKAFLTNALALESIDPIKFVEALDFEDKKADDDITIWKRFVTGQITENEKVTLPKFLDALIKEKKEGYPELFTELKEYSSIKKELDEIASFIEDNPKTRTETRRLFAQNMVNLFIKEVQNVNKKFLEAPPATIEIQPQKTEVQPNEPEEEKGEEEPQAETMQGTLLEIEPDIFGEPAIQKREKREKKAERSRKKHEEIEDIRKKIIAELQHEAEKLLQTLTKKEAVEFPTLPPEQKALQRPTVSNAAKAIAEIRDIFEKNLGLTFIRTIKPGLVDTYFWGAAGYDALASAIERIIKSEGLVNKTVESLLELKEPGNFAPALKSRIQAQLNISPENLDPKNLFDKWAQWPTVQGDLSALSSVFSSNIYLRQLTLFILKMIQPEEEYKKLPTIFAPLPKKEEEKVVPFEPSKQQEIGTAIGNAKLKQIKDDIREFRNEFAPLLRVETLDENAFNTTNDISQLARLVELKPTTQLQDYFQNQKSIVEIVKQGHSFLRIKLARIKNRLENLETLGVIARDYSNVIEKNITAAATRAISGYITAKLTEGDSKTNKVTQDKQQRAMLYELMSTLSEAPLSSLPSLATLIASKINSLKGSIIKIGRELLEKVRTIEASLSLQLKEKNSAEALEHLIPSKDIMDHPNIYKFIELAPFITIKNATKNLNASNLLFKDAYDKADIPVLDFYKKYVEPILANIQLILETWNKYKELNELLSTLKSMNYLSSENKKSAYVHIVLESLKIVIAHNLKTVIEKSENKDLISADIAAIQGDTAYDKFPHKEELNRIYNDAKTMLKSETTAEAQKIGGAETTAPLSQEQQAAQELAQQKEKEKKEEQKRLTPLYNEIVNFRTLVENLGFSFRKELPTIEQFSERGKPSTTQVYSLLEWDPENIDPLLLTLDSSKTLLEQKNNDQTLFYAKGSSDLLSINLFIAKLLIAYKNFSLLMWFTDPQSQATIPSILESLEKQRALSSPQKRALLENARTDIANTLFKIYLKKYRAEGEGSTARLNVQQALLDATPLLPLQTILKEYDFVLKEIAQAQNLITKEAPLSLQSSMNSLLTAYENEIIKAKKMTIPTKFNKKARKIGTKKTATPIQRNPTNSTVPAAAAVA